MLAACGAAGIDGSSTQKSNLKVEPHFTIVNLAEVVGPSPAAQGDVARQLTKIALRRNIILRVDQAATAEYTLKGYMSLSQQQKSRKLVYMWDLVDKNGRRLTRVDGVVDAERVAKSPDPWATLHPELMLLIADKAMASLDAIPSGQSPRPVTTTPLGVGGTQAEGRAL
jgi:hypothetical protein